MNKVTGTLENWLVDSTWGASILLGDVYNDIHKRWPDGTQIHTSNIQSGEFKEGGIVTTLNSTYLLGKPLTYTVNKKT